MAHLVKSQTASSDKNRWATTWDCFQRAEELFGTEFAIDVCAEHETAKCSRFYASVEYESKKTYSYFIRESDGAYLTRELVARDALNLCWGDRFYCNPPFDLKREFINQAIKMIKRGKSGMMLLPYEPCTKWFRELIIPHATAVYVPDGRYNFLETDGVTKKTGVNFPSCFILFSPHFNGGEAKIININR